MMFGALLIIVVFAFPRGIAGELVAVGQVVMRQLKQRAQPRVSAVDYREELREGSGRTGPRFQLATSGPDVVDGAAPASMCHRVIDQCVDLGRKVKCTALRR